MRNSKSGFSLVEVVITFALVILVSVTAYTIFSTSGKNILTAIDEKKAVGYLTNALEVYKYYGDEEAVIEELDLTSSDKKADGYYVLRFNDYIVKFTIDATGFHGDCYLNGKVVLSILPYLKGVN